MKYGIILASSSPRRQYLLREMGVSFDIVVPEVEEDNSPVHGPEQMVVNNACLKARWVAEGYPSKTILAADTTVALGIDVLNKPVDMDEAWVMLRRLSGKTHCVYTGVCIVDHGEEDVFCESSEVTFKELTDEIIGEYFELVNPLDKAGAYGIQKGRDMIIEDLKGSLSNVMGLPVERLREKLSFN